MIYLFGDLRQLRSFELARPAISGPRAIARARPRLRSFFTRTDDVDVDEGTESGGTGGSGGAGRGSGGRGANANANPNPKAANAKAGNTDPHSKPNSVSANTNAGSDAVPLNLTPDQSTGSAALLSHTSTGTPLVRLGFQTELDTISEKPSHTSFCSSVSVSVSAPSVSMSPEESKHAPPDTTSDTAAHAHLTSPGPDAPKKSTTLATPLSSNTSSDTDTSSDLGIVVSPAYYDRTEQGTWQSRGSGTNGGGGRSRGTAGMGSMIGGDTGSKIGTMSAVGSVVMRWVRGGGGGGSRGRGTKSASTASHTGAEKVPGHYETYSQVQLHTQSSPHLRAQTKSQLQSQTPRPPSAAGTFGVRSWVGGRTEAITPVPYRESWSVDYEGYDAEGNGAEIGLGSEMCSRNDDHGAESMIGAGTGTMVSRQSMMSIQNGAMVSTHGHGRPNSNTGTATIDSFFPPAVVRDRDSHAHLPMIPDDEDQSYASANANAGGVHSHAVITPSQAVTAAFITRDFEPEVLASLDAFPASPPNSHSAYSSATQPGGLRMRLRSHPTNSQRRLPTPAPVQFDFDGLPAVIASPPLSRPTRAVLPYPTQLQPYPLTPLSPGGPSVPISIPAPPAINTTHPVPATVTRPRTRPAPLILVPSTPPASHIHTTLVLPGSASKLSGNAHSPSLNPTPAPKQKRSILLWDTCPRHPAVEAKLAAAVGGGDAIEASDAKLASPISPVTEQTNTSSASSPTSTNRPFSNVHDPFFAKGAVHAHPYAPSPPTLNTGTNAAPLSIPTYPQMQTTASSMKKRLRSVTSVPAFGPLTRVLEPVVSRGQWEIVVRSAMYAFVGAWVFVGVFLALPEDR
ncbi:hypothetical protein BU17DRAFT_96575 [Hysterangium stoloniferum]|nr:hypothetical protein BU17DRAFT_96575 [Hysterangium stoloniferum]